MCRFVTCMGILLHINSHSYILHTILSSPKDKINRDYIFAPVVDAESGRICSQRFPVPVCSSPTLMEILKSTFINYYIISSLGCYFCLPYLLIVLKTGYKYWFSVHRKAYIIPMFYSFGLLILQITKPSSDRLREILLMHVTVQLRHSLTLGLSHRTRIWFLLACQFSSSACT